jgi:hypothetical protein
MTLGVGFQQRGAKRRMRLVTFSWLALAAIGGIAAQRPNTPQATAPSKIDVSKLGPQVGEQVPDFRLQDQNGKTWTLQSIMGPMGAMLVFYRSADW